MADRRLRVVRETDRAGADVSMPEAIRDLAERVAADWPRVVLMVWEKPDGEFVMASLPGSDAVRRGLTETAWSKVYPIRED